MFKLQESPKIVTSLFAKPARIMFLVALFLLATMVATTAAQDETPVPDDLPPEVTILEQIVTPDSVTTVINVTTIKDTFVASNFPNTNYGGFGQLRTGYDSTFTNYGAERILMEFNIGSIPSNAIINSATFNIYQEASTGPNPNMAIQARFIASSWSEYSVTWNNHNPVWGDIIGQGDSNTINGWKTVNATNAVQEWVNGRPNYGILFESDERPDQGNQRVYHSREQANKPYLVVDYTVYVDDCAPSANINNLNAWSPATFTVGWSGSDCGSGGNPPSGIDHYNVQYSTNNSTWQDWKMHTTDTSAAFGGSNNVTYWFRVQAVDKAGNIGVYSTSKSTRVDTVPPTATITPLPTYTQSSSFLVSWSGSDVQSGIANYEVQFREAGGSWGTRTYPASQTSDWASGAEDGKTYEFRVRAIDNAGNYSAWSQTSTTVVLTPFSTILPFSPPIVNGSSFQVSWVGFAPTTITQYDIKYRVAGGAWTDWQSFLGTTTFATFDAATIVPGWDTNGTALIEFEVRAIAQNLAPEAFTGEPEAGIVADPGGNMQVQAYFPIIFQTGQ